MQPFPEAPGRAAGFTAMLQLGSLKATALGWKQCSEATGKDRLAALDDSRVREARTGQPGCCSHHCKQQDHFSRDGDGK